MGQPTPDLFRAFPGFLCLVVWEVKRVWPSHVCVWLSEAPSDRPVMRNETRNSLFLILSSTLLLLPTRFTSSTFPYATYLKSLLSLGRHIYSLICTQMKYVHFYVQSLFSHVQLFVTLWVGVCQVPPSMGFSRQEHWSGLPFPSPGDLPNPGIKLTFLMSPELAVGFFSISATWEAHYTYAQMQSS